MTTTANLDTDVNYERPGPFLIAASVQFFAAVLSIAVRNHNATV